MKQVFGSGNSGFIANFNTADGEKVYLADDATHVFSRMGFTNGRNLYLISTSYGITPQCLFAHEGSKYVDFTSGTGINYVDGTGPHAFTTDLAFGLTTNPDTDGKLNVWMDANYCINVKNRLGSARLISLRAIN